VAQGDAECVPTWRLMPDPGDREPPSGVKYRLGSDASVEAALELARLAYADPGRIEPA
jgi:hypothetical protein